MLTRAYSLLHVKAVDTEKRVIRGTATTPTPDRHGDIIDPLGASFQNPLPLLLHHDTQRPVGDAIFSKPKSDGIDFEAQLPVIEEAGPLRDRIEEAWQSVKAGLIRGVSIGFRALEFSVMKDGGLHFQKVEIVELSLVTVPANQEATLSVVKSIDLAEFRAGHDLAASGLHSPGDAGLPVVTAVKAAPKMDNTVQEQITSFENTRAAKVARMTALMTESSGQTLDAKQAEDYTTLEREVAAIDEHLPRLRNLSKTLAASATPITDVTTKEKASELRGGVPLVTVKSVLPKGTAFTRYTMAKIIGKNSLSDAIRYVEQNQQWMDQTPEVLLALKAVVNPGTVAEPAWAAPLAVARPMQEEFLELLRPMTLLGQLTGLKRVPFNISIPVQTGGGTYSWVGEGAPKPVGNLQLATATLPIAKSAGIIVISEELARVSSPSAESVIRNDMIKGMSAFLDQQFIDPTVSAVANVSPASITNGTNGYATAGTSGDNARTDLKKGISLMTTGNYPISELVFIMSEANAFAVSAALTSNGQPLFPGMTIKGGNIFGVPAITSQSAGSVVATVHTPSILYADDGGVNIDVSREATVEFNTTPTSPISAASVYVSLWQANLIGLRAERWINWKRVPRPTSQAVVYTTASYV